MTNEHSKGWWFCDKEGFTKINSVTQFGNRRLKLLLAQGTNLYITLQLKV